MKPLPFSNELNQVLLQWDDTNAEMAAASKARLDTLGSDALTELTAATAYVQHRYRVAGGVMFGPGAIFYAFMMGVLIWLSPERNAPVPPWFLWCSLGCLAMLLVELD